MARNKRTSSDKNESDLISRENKDLIRNETELPHFVNAESFNKIISKPIGGTVKIRCAATQTGKQTTRHH